MINDDDKKKAGDFVEHLLSLPNIRNEPLLIGEGLILNFIVQNMKQLQLTFKTPQFFPHLDWSQALQLIISHLYSKIHDSVLPQIMDVIDTLDFQVFNKLSDTNLPEDFQREKLTAFIENLFKNKDVRYNLNSVITIFENDILERYLGEIFEGRNFIYNDIVRVQKTNLEYEDYVTYAKIVMIIRVAAYQKMSVPTIGKSDLNINDAVKMPGKFNKYVSDISISLRQELPFVTERTIELAIKSNVKGSLCNTEDALSRLLFILASRFHNYKAVKVDRGAESPDKSWFSIASKNCDHYGFNKNMLDELYRISGDNNW